MSSNQNPEITEPVDLCLPSGSLNPAARAHSRRPLHRPNLRGWGRTKRWEYWGIITPTHVIGLTLSNIDYAAVHECYVLDRATKTERTHPYLVPFGRGASLPDTLPPLTARAEARGLHYEFREESEGTRIAAKAAGVEVEAFVESAGDSLGVVVPWSESRFQYTVKSPGRPISGVLRIDGVEHPIPAGESWAVLDRVRCRWPYHVVWNWAAGSGVVAGARIGLQLGAKWTEGTGATENALFVDGVMHYIPQEVEWRYDVTNWSAPWHMEGERLDVTLTPFHVRSAKTNLGFLGAEVHQAFGEWRGWMSDSGGARHSVDGLVGWAEQAENRW
jgi:hypothetical protein